MRIPFNKPWLAGDEMKYIRQAVEGGHLSGNGPFTQRCHRFFEERYHFKKVLLTTSCTDALEMCALLLDIQPGDEVIVPSYTFVSTALAFVRQGATIVFADSRPDHPGMDETVLESLITPRTKVIVPVHYAGVACDMEVIMAIADKYNIFVVEDAAHAMESFYNGRSLGGIGHLACFSFHETKNVQCGEGGMLVINDARFVDRAEIIWEKGTNRAAFFRGEVDKYGWVSMGSSFLPSDLSAAFLLAQLEQLEEIQRRRVALWHWYDDHVEELLDGYQYSMPVIPDYATVNGHAYYVVCDTAQERDRMLRGLKQRGIHAVFHYLQLEKSYFMKQRQNSTHCPQSQRYTQCLVRLPFYMGLEETIKKELFNTLKAGF